MIKREDCRKVGVISKTHHLQGAVIITTENNLLERYSNEPVFLLLDGAPVPFFISDEGEDIRQRNHNSFIVKFDYVDTIDKAESLLGAEVLINNPLIEEDEEFEDEEFDIYDFIDFKVEDKNLKSEGLVIDVADYSGNIILTIDIDNNEVLLPLGEDFILEIDYDNSKLITNIPEGLLNLNQ